MWYGEKTESRLQWEREGMIFYHSLRVAQNKALDSQGLGGMWRYKTERSFDRMSLPETPLGPALPWWCNSEEDNPAMGSLWNKARERQTCPVQAHLRVSHLSGFLSPMLFNVPWFCFTCVLLWWASSLSFQEIFGNEQTGGLWGSLKLMCFSVIGCGFCKVTPWGLSNLLPKWHVLV